MGDLHASPHVSLRAATTADSRLMWEWRNDPETRSASISTAIIPYDEHERWLRSKLVDEHVRILIIMNAQGEPIGQVRFDMNAVKDAAEVSIALGREYRGRGYGNAALRAACEHLQGEGGVRTLIAHIRPENVASQRIFTRAGFVFRGMKRLSGTLMVEMVRTRKGNSVETGDESQ